MRATDLTRTSPLLAASGLVLVIGLWIALARMNAGPWQDEFNTIVTARGGLSTFIEHALRGQHPLLYEGLVFLAQSAGITGIVGIRAINLLGVPLALAALWIAQRRGVLTAAQAAIVLALYGSSITLLFYVPSVRPYFLVFSASIAVTLAWLAMLRGDQRNLWLWTGALAIFVNLHYFATIFGGVLTLALLIDRAARRNWVGALKIAAVSAAAAAPALILGVLQMSYTQHGGVLYYFTPGLDYALRTLGEGLYTSASHNPIAIACAAIGLAMLLFTRRWRTAGKTFALLGVVAAFLLLLLVADLARPILFERYLSAIGGAVAVLIALLATELLPAAAAIAIWIAALGLQASAVLGDKGWWGWAMSAVAIERVVALCPSTQVYAVPYARISNGPIATTALNPTEAEARSYGYRFYADRYGFTVTDLAPGDVVAAKAPCPALIWIEHFWPNEPTVPALLANLELTASGRATWTKIGTGAVVTVYPPRP